MSAGAAMRLIGDHKVKRLKRGVGKGFGDPRRGLVGTKDDPSSGAFQKLRDFARIGGDLVSQLRSRDSQESF